MFFSFLLSAIFQTGQLVIEEETVIVEIADTLPKRNQGLMGRETLADGHGMLFVFPQEQLLSFWMKETLIPLAIGFFDSEKKLLQVEEMTPPPSPSAPLRLYKSVAPAQYALEMPQHWFKRHKIPIGAKFTLKDLSE